MASSLRSAGPLLDPDIVFPVTKVFHERTKLPTYKSVIGVLRYLTADRKNSHSSSIYEASKRIYAKWYHDTIYCLPERTIRRKVETIWNTFREGKKRYAAGRSGTAVDKYRELVEYADKLLDVYETDTERRSERKSEWGVAMSQREYDYYDDMKNERKTECDHGVEPVWYTTMMRKQREKERSEKHKKEQEEMFLFKTFDEIDSILSSQSEEEDEQETESVEEGQHSSAKKRKVYEEVTVSDDPLPVEFRHVRDSERIVKDKIYSVIADLNGVGLSMNEATKAVIIVANGLFARKWKELGTDSSIFDSNTLPHERNIRDKMLLIEAQTLSLFVDEIQEKSAEGRIITHAIDSTTKQRVGTFAAQGIHIGKNVPFPLPLMNISGETTMDIALQVDFAFEVLAAVKGTTAAEIYKSVDVHMTDSTEHNKGFAQVLADLYNLDTPAGQLFGGAHTTLGFSTAMNKMISMVEGDMKLENILSHFMVDIEADSKNGSFAGQALDMMLKLVAPEFNHKPWNYYKVFDNFLKKEEIKNVLFAYKDHRFGCLSRASAVLLYNFDWLVLFLENNPQISNRLACLVRNLLELPYIKVVLSVLAAFGVHLVEPFYCRTIDTDATHSKLKVFYKELYDSMDQVVSADFFAFKLPQFSGVSKRLFDAIIVDYNKDVVESVTTHAEEHIDDAIKLANFILPELRVVLARQRRDYGIDEEFPAQYPVEDQASNVDDTPVTNLAMERHLGTGDYRLPKLKKLAAVSRSMILARSKELRSEKTETFRSFRKEVEQIRELNLKWSNKMEEKFAAGSDEKQVLAQEKERKRLDMLEQLKALGGPFTNSDEVSAFITRSDIDDKSKQKRLKMEVKFARDSSTTLPKVDKLFRIQVTLPNKKRRDKTAREFGESLMAFLGKKSSKTVIDYKVFQDSLEKCFSFGS